MSGRGSISAPAVDRVPAFGGGDRVARSGRPRPWRQAVARRTVGRMVGSTVTMAGPDEGRHDHVVAGTGGSEAARAAVRYAAREAVARGVTLELVARRAGQPRRGPRSGPTCWRRAAGWPPAEVKRVPMVLTLLSGPGVDSLVARAAEAQLLVVGAPTPGLTERLRPESAALGAAGQAGCPVVVVPAEKHHEGQLRRIVVGSSRPSTPTTSCCRRRSPRRSGTTPSSPWCTPGGGRTPVPPSTAGTTRSGSRVRQRWSRSSWLRCDTPSPPFSCGWTWCVAARPTRWWPRRRKAAC